VGAWDKFSPRKIGLRVNKSMAQEFNGDAVRMRADSKRALEKVLTVNTSRWTLLEKQAFENLALVLTRTSALNNWTREERDSLVEIIRAKPKPDEMLYLHLTQQHQRLRKSLLAI
jgi:hypothetical protein